MFEPTNLDDMIGMKKIKKQVEISVNAALLENRPVKHILAFGPPGTGKTTMGNIIATMMGVTSHHTIGKALNVRRILSVLRPKDVLFIDEIHGLKGDEEEKLYLPMTNFRFIDPSSLYQVPVPMSAFTLVGATTRIGDLSQPLIDRFPIHLLFELYELEDMVQIVHQSSEKSKIPVEDDAVVKIASVSRSTPRIAINILQRANEFQIIRDKKSVTLEVINEVLELLNIRDNGLTDQDIAYMEILFQANRPIGANAIAATIMTSPKTVREFIEPFLLRNQYIAITGGGRILLPKGLELMMEKYYVTEGV